MTKNSHTNQPAALRVPDSPRQEEALRYWKMQLEDRLPVLDLPADHTRSAAQEYRRQTHAQKLPTIQLAALQAFARERETDAFTVLLSAFQALLWRYTGQDDLLLAVPFSLTASNGATSAKCSDAPANLVILRSTVYGSAPFHTLLAECHRAAEEAYAHRQVRLEQLVEVLFPYHDLSRAPLFQAMFAFYENENTISDFAAKTDCALAVMKKGRELECQFIYNAELFDAATITRMAGHYEALLGGILANPSAAVSKLPMMTAEEHRQVVVEWNTTHVSFPDNACLHELFEAQAEAAPDAVAVVLNDEHLTYGELNRRANQMANYLHGLGIGPDGLVGVCMERSLEMVIGLYGILKAGGAYVPMDPSYPPSRLAFMLEDTQVPVLLTKKSTVENLKLAIDNSKLHLISLDTDWEIIARASEAPVAGEVTPDHLAYVIYTSGSTGRPKGAVLNHRGRVNNFCDFNRRYEVKPGDRLLGISSLSFDMSAYDTFGTLATGGTLVLVETAAILEPSRWAELMVDQQITVWHSVPALLEMLVDYCEYREALRPAALRLALLGGDWIPVSLPDRLKAMVAGVHVVSMGGATEVSMDSTIYDIVEPSSKWKSIPYGVPMYNQLAYVLDAELQPLPIGIPGELHLGGIGVGRGYWNRPELTAQKFIPNPFSGVPGDRMYKTGDLARYRPNSNLELLGRIDFQVKIRGFRIELGEITSAIAQHPAVKEAAIVAKEEKPGQVGAEKRLVAYIVPQPQSSGPESITTSELREEQMRQWQRVYDETYAKDAEDPIFNISTWNSSYTGLPLSAEEMREWVNQSVDRILALQPRRVLELGCGTGLMLFRIAPHCEKYVGMDFSQAALDYIRRQLAKPEYHLPQVELWHRPADDFNGLAPDSFDLVILHSVAQLFPDVHYLLRVLEKATAAVRAGGFIFVGDVFSLPHLDLFHTSVQLYQAPASLAVARLQQRIQKAASQDEQLHLDPRFFHALKTRLPKISHVQMQLRRGRHLNDMTRIRYDVTLHLGGEAKARPVHHAGRWLDWLERKLTVERLRELLQKESPETLGLRRVPNARLFAEVKAKELLASLDGPQTVGELREALRSANRADFVDPEDLRSANRADFVDPEELWAIAEDLPYEVDITWSATGEVGCFDALFRRRDADAAKRIVPHFLAEAARPKPLSEYANNPLQDKLGRKLVPELRSHLQKQLPEYMVPSAFVLMEALPLSPNGKIDRRALPAPDHSRPELLESFAAPRNALEEVVAQIWAEVFAFESIGIHDNFLELGGHSLLAIQIMTRLQEIFPVALPLAYLFNSPTVAGLSARIEQAGREAQIDLAEVARVFLEVSRFSDADVEKMLAQETAERM